MEGHGPLLITGFWVSLVQPPEVVMAASFRDRRTITGFLSFLFGGVVEGEFSRGESRAQFQTERKKVVLGESSHDLQMAKNHAFGPQQPMKK